MDMLLENKNAVIYGRKEPSAVRWHVPSLAKGMILLKRLPALAEVANVAAFMASDRASAMTGTVVNLTCGSVVD
jgi:hypothetical protein